MAWFLPSERSVSNASLHFPFTLSLSKGKHVNRFRSWFDKLTTNGL
jgi:hypothetical protein